MHYLLGLRPGIPQGAYDHRSVCLGKSAKPLNDIRAFQSRIRESSEWHLLKQVCKQVQVRSNITMNLLNAHKWLGVGWVFFGLGGNTRGLPPFNPVLSHFAAFFG